MLLVHGCPSMADHRVWYDSYVMLEGEAWTVEGYAMNLHSTAGPESGDAVISLRLGGAEIYTHVVGGVHSWSRFTHTWTAASDGTVEISLHGDVPGNPAVADDLASAFALDDLVISRVASSAPANICASPTVLAAAQLCGFGTGTYSPAGGVDAPCFAAMAAALEALVDDGSSTYANIVAHCVTNPSDSVVSPFAMTSGPEPAVSQLCKREFSDLMSGCGIGA